MIIGLAGKIGSGKDLAGTYLQHIAGEQHSYDIDEWELEHEGYREYMSDWDIQKFGGPLKDVVCILLGCTREQLEDREFKEKELGKEWHVDDYKPTVRDLLQRMGTEAGREQIHPDIWVNALFSKYKQQELGEDIEDGTRYMVKGDYPNWIITDVRFPNEVKAIEDRGGVVIKIHRPGLESSRHESEIALDNWNFTYKITNDGTKEELYRKLVDIYSKIKNQMVV